MNLIGVSGFARAGKDTFVNIGMNILKKNGKSAIRLAFADELKKDLNSFLKEKYGISAFTTDTKEKELIRPFLVAHGCGKRMQTDGKCWIDKLDKELESGNYNKFDYVFVSDVRFTNEASWIQRKWNGSVIHLKRYITCSGMQYDSITGKESGFQTWKQYDPAPNEEESKNDPLVQQLADVHIQWESRGIPAGRDVINDEYLNSQVLEALSLTKFFKHQTIGMLSL